MADLPPIPPTRDIVSIPDITQPMITHISKLLPGRKYSYTKSNSGIDRQYEGIFYKQTLDYQNPPQYVFNDVIYHGPNINLFLGSKTYGYGHYPTNFIEIPMLNVPPVIGTKYIEPVPRTRLPRGGKFKKTKRRRRRGRGTRKH